MTTNQEQTQPGDDDEPISLDAEIDRLMAMGAGQELGQAEDEAADDPADASRDDARRTADEKTAAAAEEHQARRAAGERPPRGKL